MHVTARNFEPVSPPGTRVERPPIMPPHGVGVAVIIGALIVGAGASILVARYSLGLAALTGGLLVGTSGLSLRLVGRTVEGLRALALVALLTLSYFYVVILALESIVSAQERHLISPLVAIALMLGAVVAALVMPVAITAYSVRRANRQVGRGRPTDATSDYSGTTNREPLPDMTPLLLGTCLGAAFMILWALVLCTALIMSPRGWSQVVTAFVLALGLPALFRPLWIAAYRTALARWRVPVPAALLESLSQLRELTHCEFDRVMCLRASFGSGKPCFVILGARRSTLVISEQIVRTLSSDQLLAVLAHEAAHVVMNHGNRKLAWGALGAAAFISCNVGGQLAIGGLVPQSLGFARVLIVLLPLGVLRQLYDHYVTRRHEAEADGFATGLVGAPALLGALEALGGNRSYAHMHNRWTTHGTWERRSARIREKGGK